MNEAAKKKPLAGREKIRIKNKDIFWRNLFYQVLYLFATSPLPEIIFVMALVFSANQSSTAFNYYKQIWLPVLLLSAVASAAFMAYRIILGKGSAAHLAALLFTYAFYSYYATGSATTHSLLPKIASSPLKINILQCLAVAAVLLACAGLAAWALRWMIARFSLLKNLQAFKILLLVVAIVFVLEIIRFTERYFSIH